MISNLFNAWRKSPIAHQSTQADEVRDETQDGDGDREALLPNARSARVPVHEKECLNNRQRRDVYLSVKASLVTSCVWLVGFIGLLLHIKGEKQGYTDDVCMKHISHYCT